MRDVRFGRELLHHALHALSHLLKRIAAAARRERVRERIVIESVVQRRIVGLGRRTHRHVLPLERARHLDGQLVLAGFHGRERILPREDAIRLAADDGAALFAGIARVDREGIASPTYTFFFPSSTRTNARSVGTFAEGAARLDAAVVMTADAIASDKYSGRMSSPILAWLILGRVVNGRVRLQLSSPRSESKSARASDFDSSPGPDGPSGSCAPGFGCAGAGACDAGSFCEGFG